MAQYEIKFLDKYNDKSISVKKSIIELYSKHEDVIHINIYFDLENQQSIFLDKSTAIKFAKTLRTEINKIQEV